MTLRTRSVALAALFTLLASACTAIDQRTSSGPVATGNDTLAADARARPPRTLPAPLLLVSIDGFRADYLDLGITPTLSRIAREGVRAAWMNPSYPSLTFPNHYTLVTGLRPDRHGIVHNTMADPGLGGFSLGNRDAVGDGRWWGGEPIWVGAHKAGLRTATYFWPGSEAAVQGIRPDHWKQFDGATPYGQRVDTVLGWLSEPDSARPRVITLYFEGVDKAGHEHGPDSPQAMAALRHADAAITRLLDGLEARAILDQVNLVVVSDHGMATTVPERTVALEDMVSPQEGKVVTSGQSVGIELLSGGEAPLSQAPLVRHDHYECWRKHELPTRWRYGRHDRVPSIVCQMDEGWDAIPRDRLEQRRAAGTRGSHGYDPALPSMRALFVARGPAFRRGVKLPAFDNVDVYPLLARLLRITPAANDGDITSLLPALKD